MERVAVDQARVDLFADYLRRETSIRPFDFCAVEAGQPLPPRDEPGVLELFFFATAHQFGFWYEAEGRYSHPMVARLEGVLRKGSDYLFRCCTRAWEVRPDFFAPEHLATLSYDDWDRVFMDDGEVNPLPMWPSNLAIIDGYVSWFADHRITPAELVAEANAAPRVLTHFLARAGAVPGYAEDDLRKKLLLLAVILENRPERFLRVNDPDAYRPIIDYHLQRSALRTGLIQVRDGHLRERLAARSQVSAAEEDEVRRATYAAIRQLVDRSEKNVAAVDWFFFTNRRRCPEMDAPDCGACPVQGICARYIDLFQPVFRTTAY